MKFKFIANSSGIFYGNKGTKVLCDPWIVNGVFDGSWYHYPPITTTLSNLEDVDAIYLSHVHPDHYDERYFDFDKDIPIFVLDHGPNFLKNNLSRAGYKNLILIKDGETAPFNEFDVSLYAPFAKHNFHDAKIGNIIDSAMVIKSGENTVLNANDNTLTIDACHRLNDAHGPIDMAMLNYNAAGPYPSCFNNLTEEEKRSEHDRIILRNYDHMCSILQALKPSLALPFAGAYIIAGKQSHKNAYLGTSTWDACADYLRTQNIPDTRLICLREHDTLDLDLKTVDKGYVPVDLEHMQRYISEDLPQKQYPYELDEAPDQQQLIDDIATASTRMLERMQRYKLELNTSIHLELEGLSIPIYLSAATQQRYLHCQLDNRLLRRILNRASHWNNAEIGCHIEFERKPNFYEPDVHTALQFFHL